MRGSLYDALPDLDRLADGRVGGDQGRAAFSFPNVSADARRKVIQVGRVIPGASLNNGVPRNDLVGRSAKATLRLQGEAIGFADLKHLRDACGDQFSQQR